LKYKRFIYSVTHHIIKYREAQIFSLYSKIKRIQNEYVDIYAPHFDTDPISTEQLLRSDYGGKQFHLKSNDPAIEKFRYGYIDFNNNCLSNHQSCSQPTTHNSNPVQKIIEQISQTLHISRKLPEPPPLFGRYCDNRCNIPNFWASRLYANLMTIYPVSNFKLLQNNLVNFEKCFQCHQSLNKQCQSIETCCDNFRVINSLSDHYQGLRTISRLLYQVRAVNLHLIKIDNYILECNLQQLIHLTAFESLPLIHGPARYKLKAPDILVDVERASRFNLILTREMEKKLTSIECISCHRLFVKERVCKVKDQLLENHIFKQLTQSYSGRDYFLCREQCFKQIYKDEHIPIFSSLNNMCLDFPPDVLTNLNLYEKMLIQLGKCFHNIFRLQMHRKNSSVQSALGLKGLSIHLPLNLTETHGYLADQLPCADTTNIIIDGLPTKTGNIWRQLVNLDKVYAALDWLTANNPIYSHVAIIDKASLVNSASRALIPEITKSLSKEERATLSNLKQCNETELAQFSVIDLDKINENRSDIDKYCCRKITATPLSDSDKNMDHACFPAIYPYGTGGMLDNRILEV